MEERKTFSVTFHEARLIGDVLPAHSHPSWLFLHGAGQADRTRFEKLRLLLLSKGIASCAFDFIGHGETGGDLHTTSLESRTNQALKVVQAQGLPSPLSIVAASMSGYTAIQLTKSCDVHNLILLAPGVYDASVYSVLFGSQFTRAIHEPGSWQNTDAWEILKKYTGNLLIFVGDHDQVIPQELIEKLYQSATHANRKKVITIKDATHPLGKWLDEHPGDCERVFEEIMKVTAGSS